MRNLAAASVFVVLLFFSVSAVAFDIRPATAQLPSGSYKWVAITKQDWVPIVQPLADVRTAKGLPAYIASVEWIYANYPGADKPEQIHNFMKQAYESWDVKYLLIAGDILAVPTYYLYEEHYRAVYNESTNAWSSFYTEFYANHRPTDWYYGCFDKPEVVAVGRLPAANATDLQVMVQKTVSYESNPPEGAWRRTAINAYIDEFREPSERVRADLSGFNQIEYTMHLDKIEHSDMTWTFADQGLASMINDGASIIYVNAHGSPLGAGTLNVDMAKTLRNGLKLPIVFAGSCETAMFDWSYAELLPPFNEPYSRSYVPLELLRNPLGGCVSYIGYIGVGGELFPIKYFFRDYRLGTMMATKIHVQGSQYLPDIAILGDPALRWVGASQYGSSITLQAPSKIEIVTPNMNTADVVVAGKLDMPIAGVAVKAEFAQKIEGQTPLCLYPPGPTATTNADGSFQYTLSSLQPGTYVLWAWWSGAGGRVGACSEFIEVGVVFSPTPTVPPPQTPRCIIATAAYGSELAPEVAYMRYVRDSLIGSSATGRSLVSAWNTFYYSWSPIVASLISNSAILKLVFRVLLVPLVGIVQVAAWSFSVAALFSTDLASIVAFIAAAFMSIVVYVAAPVKVFLAVLKKLRATASSFS